MLRSIGVMHIGKPRKNNICTNQIRFKYIAVDKQTKLSKESISNFALSPFSSCTTLSPSLSIRNISISLQTFISFINSWPFNFLPLIYSSSISNMSFPLSFLAMYSTKTSNASTTSLIVGLAFARSRRHIYANWTALLTASSKYGSPCIPNIGSAIFLMFRFLKYGSACKAPAKSHHNS